MFGSREKLPEKLAPRHLAIQINNALHDLFCKYPEALLFGEDVAQKGGVYTVTKGLHKAFQNQRVFNTLLDETMILGLAQGYSNMGMLSRRPRSSTSPISTTQATRFAARRASLQFFSNGQYRQPDAHAHGVGSATRGVSADTSTTILRLPRCATFPASWPAARAAATMRR